MSAEVPETESEGEPRAGRRGVALGFLAMVPLFLAYELGVHAAGAGGPRNAAELFLGRALVFLSAYETAVRIAFLAGCAIWAFVRVRLDGLRLGRSILRVGLEGVLGALALGPLLVLLCGLFDLSPADLGLDAAGEDLDLARAGRLLGAGAWEEILFRVGLYSLVFLLTIRLVRFLGAGGHASRLAAELTALAASSLAFAAFHLDALSRLLGIDGEPYDGRLFLWRTLAGALLAVVFRWRGPGVAAWTHGLFNLALVLGSGPGVFR